MFIIYNAIISRLHKHFFRTRVVDPFPCFDIFFCAPAWSSLLNYYCLGILCLMLLITALLMNIIYLPSFTLYNQRNGTDVLLTVLVSCDVFLIIISAYIDHIPFIFKTHEKQLSTYSKYVALIVPYFVPCQSFLQTTSSWILCCLLFERYLYQIHGKHAKLMFSFRTSMFTIISIATVLFGFTIFKFFNVTSKSDPNGRYSVHYTKIGLNENYHNLITNWLKVPLEYFGPLVVLVSLLCLIYTNLGEQGLSTNVHEVKSGTYKKLKNLVIINESKRDDRILISVLLMSTMAIVVKLPKFVHHILVNEEANISMDKLHYVMISYLILDAIFLFVKPFIYIYISPTYCSSLHRYFIASCPGNQDDSVGMSMTFEQTIANKMRESISYRSSIWAMHEPVVPDMADMPDVPDVADQSTSNRYQMEENE